MTMPYAESFPKVEKIIHDVISDAPGVLPELLPEIARKPLIATISLSKVVPHCITPDNYWEVTFVHRRIKS
ncbi:MAG: hypothetical protein R3C26_13805 [Calditrichia bacterium]